MKKWLVFILLVVAVTATVSPCCGIHDNCTESLTSTANQEDHEEEGVCSPFITCGTCPGFTQTDKASEIPIIVAEKQVHCSNVLTPQLSSYKDSLLQPPRIA